jgi:hypothetical protein
MRPLLHLVFIDHSNVEGVNLQFAAREGTHLKLLCAAAIAAEAFALAAAPAMSAPVQVRPAVATSELPVTEVRHRGRRHGGGNAGAVIGGFAAGAIVGGIIAGSQRRYYEPRYYYEQPRVYYRPRVQYQRSYGLSRHDRWCLNRYRSYDPASNTFQPYHGPRRYCNSPYN